MTRETFTRWTCNACSTSKDMAGSKQPKGWVGYGFTRPDIPAASLLDLGHLCTHCAARVNAAMEVA